MAYLIQETKYNSFYCGCYDYSEFCRIPQNKPSLYFRFGSDYDAEWYYCLEHALEDLKFILDNESYWKADELRIYNADTDTTLTIEEAQNAIRKI